ncbi:hypothetical protein [Sphingomonas bacterium]|uniref:hypothetical protein n=1 Tax=Sphingomonas bacterium TaxID=1895847 RepID=UPI0015758BF7|nr:hypothetical protein [Sphingomonas bacterium]
MLNVLFGTGMAGALAVWLKTRPKMREVNLTADEKLREDLLQRVAKLEADAAANALIRENERARHEAELAIMRHRVNNSDQCLDALLLLLKTSPEKVDQAVHHIEAMRARQKEEIALEKGAQAGAKVATTAAVVVPT